MHLYAEEITLSVCSKCGKPVQPHTVCFNCGCYKGVEVIDVLKKLTKKEKKQKDKEMAAQGKEEGEDKKTGHLSMEGLSKK